MNWLALLMPLLRKLLEWLMTQFKKKGKLTPKQRKRLNTFIARCRQCEEHAVKLGCIEGGIVNKEEEAEMEAGR